MFVLSIVFILTTNHYLNWDVVPVSRYLEVLSRLMAFHINMYKMAGCFSILPATELVPGDIVEVTGMCALSHLNTVL